MGIGILALLTSLAIAGIAAWFSIAGLMAIFSGAALAVAVMAGSLEVGKLVTASWLYHNWAHTGWLLKIYLTVAVVVLMFITSLGIFGYLSKAHSDQSITSSGAVEQVALLDEKITYQRTIIDANRKLVAQMDDVVNQTIARTTDAQGTERALQVRRSQASDRQRLVDEIAVAQQEITATNEERAPLAVEVRKVVSEVGPIRYIASLIYGDDPAENLMERAVRWMIILLVAVFDPLAVALLIAANQSMRRGITSSPGDKPNGNQEHDLSESANIPDHAAGIAAKTSQYSGGTTEESDNIQNSEPKRDSTDGILLQQPGAVDKKPEVDAESAGITATETAQKKRSANLGKTSPSLEKKITANQRKL